MLAFFTVRLIFLNLFFFFYNTNTLRFGVLRSYNNHMHLVSIIYIFGKFDKIPSLQFLFEVKDNQHILVSIKISYFFSLQKYPLNFIGI